ncbi:MAG: P1 family peptidase [Clostridia bacterium]
MELIMQKRAVDYNIRIGSLPPGKRNKITDVNGVRVGHATIKDEENYTGVTVILPSSENMYQNKMPAASYVLNGFGKSTGLIQIDELGTLEAPVALTATLNVGKVLDGMMDYVLSTCEKDDISVRSVNIPVLECNDGVISRIQNRAVEKEHVFEAIRNAGEAFPEGDVGGGTGMICHGLKGGIGSASRIVNIGGEDFTVGILVQTNYGALADLRIDGEKTGQQIASAAPAAEGDEKGSVIVILATDAPLSSRQIRRALKRVGVGLARDGSYTSHGSGEVFLGFSTANIIRDDGQQIYTLRQIKDDYLNPVFRAAAEATEEAVLNSMLCANAAKTIDGTTVHSLREYMKN